MTQLYQLTKGSDADLEEITHYTIKKWGEAKAIEYLGLIERCLCGINKSKIWKQPFPQKYPKLRVLSCEYHYIFYLHYKNKIPCIIAVLHERMDMLARIENRISTQDQEEK